MNSDKKLQAWERDIINRQRNIVFPDTVLNQARFYRNIIRSRMNLNPVQRFGILMIGCINLLGGFFVLMDSIVAFRDRSDWLGGLVSTWVCLWLLLIGYLFAHRGLTAASTPRPPRWWLRQRSRRP